jgi:nucleoside phosphorylase
VGDIFVPEQIVEIGTAATILCDPILSAAARTAKRLGALLSSPKIIASATEKARLAGSAGAVDMESFTVISAAQKRGIPAIAVRVISDTSDQDMPVNFSKGLDENGQVSIGAVLKLLAGQPGKIAALMKLGRQSKQAADALAEFLSAYLQVLPETLRAKSTALASG